MLTDQQKAMDSMTLETRGIDELKDWPGNPKAHTDIDKSVERFGPRWPILIQKSSGRIVAGHARRQAYRKAGIKKVKVLVWDCTDEEAKSFLIADNRLTMMSGWNEEKLSEMLEELREVGMDEFTGFDPGEIDDLLKDVNFDMDGEGDMGFGEGEGKKVECPKCGFRFEV